MGHQSGLYNELRKVNYTVSLSHVVLCVKCMVKIRCDVKYFVNN